MPDARAIVTAPMAPAAGLGVTQLATIVAADALVRRAWSAGRAAELVVPTIRRDHRGQYAFDLHLAREGLERGSLPAAESDRRREAFEADRGLAAAEMLARLSVTADLGSATTASEATVSAARTAFVRLFDAGQIELTDQVVASCPKCRVAVDAVDTLLVDTEVEELTLQLWAENGAELLVRTTAPELLPGAVAVAVAPGSVGEGSDVRLPITGRLVPVIGDAMRARPALVVPAHDGEDLVLASGNGLRPIPVLDDEGSMAIAGPLAGLARYAARAKARTLLDAEGVVAGVEASTEETARCGRCGTTVVPIIGRHWFLRAAPLELAAADSVRNGMLHFSPPEARDAFLASAGVRRDWCLSTGVSSGARVPAATCIECHAVSVEASGPGSCGKCMGTTVADDQWLDARFVAATWALVHAGLFATRAPWGRTGRRLTRPVSPPAETVVVASSSDLIAWVLPAVALGLRLCGQPPFAAVVVHPWLDHDASIAGALIEPIDHRVVRLALVAGDLDLDAADAAVAALDRPDDAGELDTPASESAAVAAAVADAVADGVAALDALAPARAAALLASALAGGVPAGVADRLRALALPILGD